MITQRFVAPALMVAVLLAGCSKTDKDKAAPAAPASGAAASTPTSALPTGAPIKLKDLAAIALPKPAGAPASGNWKDIGDNESDGYRQVNYVDKENYWYSVDLLDCRAKVVKDALAMKPEDRGALKWCFLQPNDKLKDYPMIKPEKGSVRAVKAGNVIVVGSLGMTGMETLKAADVEKYIGALDLAAIAKL